MARTVLQAFAVYYCCCAMAAPHPAEVAGGGGGGGGGGSVTTIGTLGGGAAPPAVARNKRWSTTFGANSANKNATINYIVRDCSTDSDCLDTPDTSCGIDPTDRKKRCLCADGKQPLNGDCLKKPRALRTSCENDVECLPNAVCKNNATTSNPRLKICMCKDGFTEEKESCNYAELLTINYTTLLIAVFSSWIWNDGHA